MTQQSRKSSALNTPLSTAGSRTTLRLRVLMEHQQRIEIGERIRALREASPHTNASIADAVGVGERAVANWISGGTGITYKNAGKVAKLFGVDLVWLWTGQENDGTGNGVTPDPFAAATSQDSEVAGALAEIQAQLREVLAGQLVLKTRLVKIEKALGDSGTQKQPVVRRRRAGS